MFETVLNRPMLRAFLQKFEKFNNFTTNPIEHEAEYSLSVKAELHKRIPNDMNRLKICYPQMHLSENTYTNTVVAVLGQLQVTFMYEQLLLRT